MQWFCLNNRANKYTKASSNNFERSFSFFFSAKTFFCFITRNTASSMLCISSIQLGGQDYQSLWDKIDSFGISCLTCHTWSIHSVDRTMSSYVFHSVNLRSIAIHLPGRAWNKRVWRRTRRRPSEADGEWGGRRAKQTARGDEQREEQAKQRAINASESDIKRCRVFVTIQRALDKISRGHRCICRSGPASRPNCATTYPEKSTNENNIKQCPLSAWAALLASLLSWCIHHIAESLGFECLQRF